MVRTLPPKRHRRKRNACIVYCGEQAEPGHLFCLVCQRAWERQRSAALALWPGGITPDAQFRVLAIWVARTTAANLYRGEA
jgi:hypothetical protein